MPARQCARPHERLIHLTTFSDLALAAPILKALAEKGYATPTPIQVQAIPCVLAGKDLLGIAQTGTGKTAAFALPILDHLARTTRAPRRQSCRALILSPTRELATQIANSFRAYGRHLGLSVAVVVGGVSHRPQAIALARGVDVLVATPGRLIDHLGERNVSCAETEIFVLDEADQMLDLGFLPSIRRIVALLAGSRQNLFFSATMPREVGKLANELLRDPVRIAVAPVATTVDTVTQRVIHVETRDKRSLLVRLFADAAISRALVFTRTKRGADRVASHLKAAGIAVTAIHGNKSQGQRERALTAFRASKVRVLVATDIAARGIDIEQVTHVVNFELPDVPESYVHRIGRTARGGAAGVAISLCDPGEIGQLREIERLTRRSIPSEDHRNDKGAINGRSAREPDNRARRHRNTGAAAGRETMGRGCHEHSTRWPQNGHKRHGNGYRWPTKPARNRNRRSPRSAASL